MFSCILENFRIVIILCYIGETQHIFSDCWERTLLNNFISDFYAGIIDTLGPHFVIVD